MSCFFRRPAYLAPATGRKLEVEARKRQPTSPACPGFLVSDIGRLPVLGRRGRSDCLTVDVRREGATHLSTCRIA